MVLLKGITESTTVDDLVKAWSWYTNSNIQTDVKKVSYKNHDIKLGKHIQVTDVLRKRLSSKHYFCLTYVQLSIDQILEFIGEPAEQKKVKREKKKTQNVMLQLEVKMQEIEKLWKFQIY